MKVLPTARILLVDPQSDRREALRSALAVFGVGAIHQAATIEQLADPQLRANIDVAVVRVDDLEQAPENPCREGLSIPAILIAEVPGQALVRVAARGGYDAALGAPLAPRLLYRRIGSVLQRARRVVRSAPMLMERLPTDSLAADPAPLLAQAS